VPTQVDEAREAVDDAAVGQAEWHFDCGERASNGGSVDVFGVRANVGSAQRPREQCRHQGGSVQLKSRSFWLSAWRGTQSGPWCVDRQRHLRTALITGHLHRHRDGRTPHPVNSSQSSE